MTVDPGGSDTMALPNLGNQVLVPVVGDIHTTVSGSAGTSRPMRTRRARSRSRTPPRIYGVGVISIDHIVADRRRICSWVVMKRSSIRPALVTTYANQMLHSRSRLRVGYAYGAGVITVDQIVTGRHNGVGLAL